MRGPVIIVEGPDGGGKTTLAKGLRERWNAAYHHQGPYKGDPLVETIRLLERPANRGWVVCDRLHLGEQVYGPIFRQRDALGDAGRRMLERYLLARGSVVVRALPPFEVAHRNWWTRRQSNGEMFHERFGAVYGAFERLRSYLPVIHYDYTMPDVTIAGFGALVERYLAPVRGADPWERVLLVGERPSRLNVASPGAPPFCGRGGSAEWLAEQLDRANIDESRLVWVNAHPGAGPGWSRIPARALVEDRVALKTIALGRVAEAWCLRNMGKVRTFTALPHPQAWKRFHHRQPYELLKVLKEIL